MDLYLAWALSRAFNKNGGGQSRQELALPQRTLLLEVELICRSSMAYEPYPQKEGSVGIAIIITNGYEGEYSLPGTQDDGKHLRRSNSTFAGKEI